jgi:hypothetical protein
MLSRNRGKKIYFMSPNEFHNTILEPPIGRLQDKVRDKVHDTIAYAPYQIIIY